MARRTKRTYDVRVRDFDYEYEEYQKRLESERIERYYQDYYRPVKEANYTQRYFNDYYGRTLDRRKRIYDRKLRRNAYERMRRNFFLRNTVGRIVPSLHVGLSRVPGFKTPCMIARAARRHAYFKSKGKGTNKRNPRRRVRSWC